MDEVGSQLEGQGHVTGNGTEVHVSGSTGRQLAPGLLYIDQDKNQNAAAKVNQILYTEEIESAVFPPSVRKYFYVTKSVLRKQSLPLAAGSFIFFSDRNAILYIISRNKSLKNVSPYS